MFRKTISRFDYDDSYEAGTASPYLQQRQRELLKSFNPYRRRGLFLDVGCGAGDLIRTAKELGWSASGVEISESALAVARTNGFEVHKGSLQDCKLAANAYDVVVVSEVIEHVEDAPALLAEVVRVLRPGGLCYITTPHGAGVTSRLLCGRWTVAARREHIQLFSRQGLRGLLFKAGFTDVTVSTANLDPFDYLRLLRNKGNSDPYSYSRMPATRAVAESFNRSGWRLALKRAVNRVLDATSLGDTLRVRAVK